ncbi:PH domain-containing protein [Variovorax paradoxus]|uniref:PH domain-containing protein n=1 Tax=Variovorax paradoxus TaxID=34073 RepID=UPI0029C802E8|nr:PH domain-containing protein [Variovorax paradoxus]
MSTLKLTNYNAMAARLLAFLLFGVPGALGFLYGTYLWLQQSSSFTDWASLKELGGPLLGLGIAVVFTWLVTTTEWSVTLDAQGLRVRTLTRSRNYGWPDLRAVALRSVRTKVVLAGHLGPTVNKTLNVAFVFDAKAQQSVHEVLIRKTDVESLVQCLEMAGRGDLLQ